MSNEKDKNQKNEHSNSVLPLTINRNQYEWNQQYITGAEIRKLGDIPPDDEIYLAIKKPWEDEPILNETSVNFARPEIEHFYSKNKHNEIALNVNGRVKPWVDKTINFEQVVILAFGSYDPNPNKAYTVTYDKGPHDNPSGTMVRGDKVCVKDKMIFNVTCTDKS